MTTTTATQTSTGSSSSANATLAAGQSTLSSSYSTFLTLLTTQLKNQDPTSPLDTNQFTQQLVQMTGVQQQLLSNQLLQQLVSQSSGGQGVVGAVNLIGKSVTADSADVTLSGGAAKWDYTLGAGAVSGTATITNASGVAVWSGPLTSLTSGVNSFAWNGKNAAGSQLPDGGVYTLSITAQDINSASVSATPQISGTVTSVQQNSQGQAVLAIGKTLVPVSTVISVAPV